MLWSASFMYWVCRRRSMNWSSHDSAILAFRSPEKPPTTQYPLTFHLLYAKYATIWIIFLLQTEFRLCSACGEPISDKFLLEVSGRNWHARCLRCCVCQLQLDRQPSCFIRDRAVYCKADYAKWVVLLILFFSWCFWWFCFSTSCFWSCSCGHNFFMCASCILADCLMLPAFV